MRAAFTITVLAACCFSTSACTTPDADIVYFPDSDGRTGVVVTATSKNEAEMAAIVAAQSYCQRDGRDAVLVARHMSYRSQKHAGVSQPHGIESIATPASGSHGQTDHRTEQHFICQ